MREEEKYNIIMDILVSKGLDSRFRTNPEAVRQICGLINDAVRVEGDSITSSDIYSKRVEQILGRESNVIQDADREFSILSDGSFSVRTVSKNANVHVLGDKDETDQKINFVIGEKNNGLVVTSKTVGYSSGSYSQEEKNEDVPGETAIVAKNVRAGTVRFDKSVFNKHGLEMMRRSLQQSCTVYTSKDYAGAKEFFDSYSSQLPDIVAEDITRGRDLVTQKYEKYTITSRNGLSLINKIDSLMGQESSNDLFNSTGRLGAVFNTGISVRKAGKYPNNHSSGLANHRLYGIMDGMKSDEDLGHVSEIVARGQESAKYIFRDSPEFRATLFEAAENDPEMKTLLATISIGIGSVSVAAYREQFNRTAINERQGMVDCFSGNRDAGKRNPMLPNSERG